MNKIKSMSFFGKIAVVLALSCAVCSCGEKRASSRADAGTLFEMSLGGVEFSAKIALYDGEKMRGLMFVESLPENEGMVFVFDSPQRASFWMKNTLIPLDLGFFDKDGTLTEVKKLYPQNLDSVASSREDIAYCIEMNAGWFSKNGLKSPAKLDMKKLEAAVAARRGK